MSVFTLIEHGEVYTPAPLGVQSVLVCEENIARVGPGDATALAALGLPWERIDASGCIITPGFIDPHQHLIGVAGEAGFASRMPEFALRDIVSAGITTVVGCLGTDTVTRHLTTLLARARQLQARGITAYMYTGGFQVPTPTITPSVMHDLILIDAVIGVGEVAIADVRSSQPSRQELARLVADAMVGGMVGGKAGVTHLHVGPGRARLSTDRQNKAPFLPPRRRRVALAPRSMTACRVPVRHCWAPRRRAAAPSASGAVRRLPGTA